MFADGDVDGAAALLETHPELARHTTYDAHPLFREFVYRNNGHCYKDSHIGIADLLTPKIVRSFRDAVLNDQLDDVRGHLRADVKLVHAEFAAGRGIAQAIHHWKSPAVAELLFDAGADHEVMTTRGESPITMQLRFGTVDGVRYLLEKGANPNHGSGGHMPSHSMVELIELLLEHGWDINNGPLLHDANHGHGTRVQTWLKYGANPDAKNASGQTALHLFARRGTGRGAIRALVDAGADVNVRDRDGNTPLDLARLADKQTAARELISLGAEPHT